MPARRSWGLALLLLTGCTGEAAMGRPWIHKVRIHGNQKLRSGAIKGRIATQATSWIPFSPKRYLDHPFMIDTDKERIEALYHTEGLYAGKVTAAELTPYKKDGVDVNFTVKEGEYTRVRRVTVAGLDALPPAKAARARRLLRLAPGRPFQHLEYLASKAALSSYLLNQGYAWAEVEGRALVERDRLTADVELQVALGPKAVLGQIKVAGYKTASPTRLAYHSGLRTGQPFTQRALDEAQSRLYALGFFASVKMNYEHAPGRPEVADLTIEVAESTRHELRLGGGFGLEAARTDAHFKARYLQRNFYGGLRTFTLDGTLGYATVPALWTTTDSGAGAATIQRKHGPILDLSGRLTQPDLLGPYSELSATLSYNVGLEYAYLYHGPRFEVGLQRTFFSQRLRVGISYQFQLLDFFCVTVFCGTNDLALLENPATAQYLYGFVDPYRLGFLQQDISLDLRNRQLDPTKGGYFAVSVQEGGVWAGGAFQYQKILPDARGYLPLGSRVVLAGRVLFGQIWVQGDLSSPTTQRFYLGGPNSHRGFNYNRLSPQVCSEYFIGSSMNSARKVPCDQMAGPNSEIARLPIGGDQMLLAQLELRVKLFRLFNNWFSAAAFADAGDVAAPACAGQNCSPEPFQSKLELLNLHLAVGGGLRYQTVIGTIRFDLGVRLNRLTDEYQEGALRVQTPDPVVSTLDRLAFHISIGEAF